MDRRNSRGESALMVASRHGHQNVTLFLLENGADPNLRSTNGHTAVHEACRLFAMIKSDTIITAYLVYIRTMRLKYEKYKNNPKNIVSLQTRGNVSTFILNLLKPSEETAVNSRICDCIIVMVDFNQSYTVFLQKKEENMHFKQS